MERRHFGPPWPELPGRTTPPVLAAAGSVLGVIRMAAAIVALCLVGSAACVVAPFLDTGGPGRRARRFRLASFRIVLAATGARVVETGRRPDRPALVVSNHYGWLESLAFGALVAPAFTAFARGWPLVGFLMRRFGTLDVPRSGNGALGPVVAAAASALRAGTTVWVYPEGATSFGPGTLPFRPAFFQAAIDAGAPVAVASFRFETDPPWPSPERVAHWVDWTSILTHAYRLFSVPRIRILVRWDGWLARTGDRKAMAADARRMCEEGLAALSEESGSTAEPGRAAGTSRKDTSAAIIGP